MIAFPFWILSMKTGIPKNWHHGLVSRWNSLRLLWSRFSNFGPLLWPFFHFKCETITHLPSMVMNGCINSKILRWNTVKHSIETSSRNCFCSTMSKGCTHITHSFLMSKFSINARCRALFEIPTMYVKSHNYVTFLYHFWRGHLIWSTITLVVLADRMTSF